MSHSHPQAIFQIRRRTLYVCLALALMVLILNSLLLSQNMRLRSELRRVNEPSPELSIGVNLPSLSGLNAQGERASIGYGQGRRKTLLLVFAPGCAICEENIPNWEKLLENVNKKSVRVVGISLVDAGVQEFISNHRLDMEEVLTNISSRDREQYKLAQVPQMVLIDQGGKVEKVWTGLVQDVMWKDVENTLAH